MIAPGIGSVLLPHRGGGGRDLDGDGVGFGVPFCWDSLYKMVCVCVGEREREGEFSELLVCLTFYKAWFSLTLFFLCV